MLSYCVDNILCLLTFVAQSSIKAKDTAAAERIPVVLASTTVHARIRGTFVHICYLTNHLRASATSLLLVFLIKTYQNLCHLIIRKFSNSNL